MPNSRKENQSVKDHYRPWKGLPNLYLLLCDGARLTVRSQQVRAMNLVYALYQKLSKGTPVAVIGGGAAGITFAAAAACLGAHVKLFEAQKLMHLQLGSWHRPLHPEVYTWPDHTAYRPVSHMPLVGWSTGPASEVATEIVDKFRSLADRRGKTRLKIIEGKKVQINRAGRRIVKGPGKKPSPKNEIVIMATGFGVERSLPGLPLLSYWRSDYLDQPFLGHGKGPIVIVGSGDGGLCDLLRACVPYTDQTTFLDTVLQLTLSDENLRNAVARIKRNYRDSSKNGLELEREYRRLRGGSLSAIDKLLKRNKRPGMRVQWLIREDSPFNSPSLPIYRFLVSRLLKHRTYFKLSPKVNFVAGKAEFKDGAWVIKPQPPEDKLRKDKLLKYEDVDCRHVVYRAGQERESGKNGLLSSVINSFDPSLSRPEMRTLLNKFRLHPATNHKDCNEPKGWHKDENFLKKLKPEVGPLRPLLLAEFVMAFHSPDPIDPRRCPFVFRIRIWLRGLAEGVTARYDLHPEEPNPFTRPSTLKNGMQWLNTRNDYTIRVRLHDGREWSDYSVLGALHARYSLRKGLDTAYGAMRCARQRMRVKNKVGRKYFEGKSLAVAEALRRLEEQSGYTT